MSDVPGIREVNTSRPAYVDQLSELAKGLNVNEKGSALVKEVVGLLNSDRSMRVTNAPVNHTEVGKPTGATGIPCLDNPDIKDKGLVGYLEKLISELRGEMDDGELKSAINGLQNAQKGFDSTNAEALKRFDESMKSMDAAAKANKGSRFLKWLGAIVSVFVAVTACVATGGVATAAVIAAAVAVGTCVLDETGVTEELTKDLSDALKDAGCSRFAADLISGIVVAVVPMVVCGVASFASAFGSAGQAVKTVGDVAEGVSKGVEATSKFAGLSAKVATLLPKVAKQTQFYLTIVSGSVGIGAGVASATASYDQSKVASTEALQIVLRQNMDDMQKWIEQILEMMEANLSKFARIVSDPIETSKEIAENMGQMA